MLISGLPRLAERETNAERRIREVEEYTRLSRAKPDLSVYLPAPPHLSSSPYTTAGRPTSSRPVVTGSHLTGCSSPASGGHCRSNNNNKLSADLNGYNIPPHHHRYHSASEAATTAALLSPLHIFTSRGATAAFKDSDREASRSAARVGPTRVGIAGIFRPPGLEDKEDEIEVNDASGMQSSSSPKLDEDRQDDAGLMDDLSPTSTESADSAGIKQENKHRQLACEALNFSSDSIIDHQRSSPSSSPIAASLTPSSSVTSLLLPPTTTLSTSSSGLLDLSNATEADLNRSGLLSAAMSHHFGGGSSLYTTAHEKLSSVWRQLLQQQQQQHSAHSALLYQQHQATIQQRQNTAAAAAYLPFFSSPPPVGPPPLNLHQYSSPTSGLMELSMKKI